MRVRSDMIVGDGLSSRATTASNPRSHRCAGSWLSRGCHKSGFSRIEIRKLSIYTQDCPATNLCGGDTRRGLWSSGDPDHQPICQFLAL